MTKPKAVARIPGLKESDLVSVKLAHPLGADAKQRLGIPDGASTEVNDEIRVRDTDARTLITGGYAQVDPEDSGAVAKALGEPTTTPKAERPAADDPANAPAAPEKPTK